MKNTVVVENTLALDTDYSYTNKKIVNHALMEVKLFLL